MSYPTTQPSPGADGFAALADPTRLRIITLLAERDRTVNEIAAQFTISRPAISKHLRVLHRAGFVTERKRGRERIQSFDGEALRPLADWIEHYRSFWQQRLAILKNLVEEDR